MGQTEQKVYLESTIKAYSISYLADRLKGLVIEDKFHAS